MKWLWALLAGSLGYLADGCLWFAEHVTCGEIAAKRRAHRRAASETLSRQRKG